MRRESTENAGHCRLLGPSRERSKARLSLHSGRVGQAFDLLRRLRFRCRGLGFCCLLLGGLALLTIVSVVAIDPLQAEQELIVLTNVDRTSNGVPALLPDDELRGVARFRSDDMVAQGYFSHHIPPDGHLVFDILDARGIKYLKAGENIGRTNQPDHIAVETVEQAFMNSPEHRAILLWPGYTNLGTGAAESSDGMKIYTVLFTQVPSPAPSEQAGEPPTPTPELSPSASTPTATPTEEVEPTVVGSATPSPSAPPVVTATSSATATPSTRRVELSPPRSTGLIEQIVRRILSLFLNLG